MKNKSVIVENLKPVSILSSAIRIVRKPGICLTAIRPKTLPAGMAPVTAGLALASVYNSINPVTALLTFISTAALQITANLINDYLDFVKGHDTPERLGPERSVQSGRLDVYEIQLITAAFIAIAAVSGLYLVLNSGIYILLIGVFSIVAAAAYSFFIKPFGFFGGGEASAFIFFGPVAVSGTFYIQTGFFNWSSLFSGISIGLYSLALLTVNNYRDINEDRKTGKTTLPGRYGKPAALLCYSGVLYAPFIGPLFAAFTTDNYIALLLPMLSLIPGIIIFRIFTASKPGKELNRLLFQTSLTMAFHSSLYLAVVFN